MFIGTIGMDFQTFWYWTNPADNPFIRVGYETRIKIEHETRVNEARILTAYIGNSFADKPKDFKDVYAISTDPKPKIKKAIDIFNEIANKF